MSGDYLTELRKDKVVRLENKTCPYCGVELDKSNKTREHVIGRNFVPERSLDNQWNLIVQACRGCNTEKSDLENDISAITLNHAIMYHKELPETVISHAMRKREKCYSRQTKKLIKDSDIKSSFDTKLANNVYLNIGYQASAQLDDERCYRLAQYHMLAFFYFLTFNEEQQIGFMWPEGFYPIAQAIYSDWGNDELLGFSRVVTDWPIRLHGVTANDFFKVSIKKHPTTSCWSWALEWNKSLRIVGFFGDKSVAEMVANDIPQLEWDIQSQQSGVTQFCRMERMISVEEDILFKMQNDA
ncbi:Uncharacterised protein [Plesiomonas shigelloides]|uniref:HNH endonuclease n=1 Tax=Plesiomonas shigelloides TaxID=703 RepID=UPI0007ECCBA3|nr:hypothetical protein [Plesiomonas shigelloides]SBT60899.1 Uncharacterised protein [Plesiomonas shigelloides]